jgi:hypothetical protein
MLPVYPHIHDPSPLLISVNPLLSSCLSLPSSDYQASSNTPSYWEDPLPLSLPPRASISEDIIDSQRYGLPHPLHPSSLVDEFCKWSGNVVQLDRGGPYASAAQGITVDHHESHCVAFLGFVTLLTGREPSEVSLSCYEEPCLFLSFITFLQVSSGYWMGATGYICCCFCCPSCLAALV